MDINDTTANESIRKIEDIIDIQKANGNFSVRQVAFKLPSESESTLSTNLAKSLESGLANSKSEGSENKVKKSRSKRHKSPISEVISWPSDSDITVLRMKLCLTNSDIKEKVGNEIPGDGLHQPDSSSMVNLATLMRYSQSPSKHSILDEYLLPLTSWEQGEDHGAENISPIIEEKLPDDQIIQLSPELNGYNSVCSGQNNSHKFYMNDGKMYYETSTKSKIARFLRLYFCPCCRCLYKMENISNDPSTYWEKRKEQTSQ